MRAQRQLGEYVVLLDADDCLVGDGVTKSLTLLSRDTNAVAALGRTVGVGVGGGRSELRQWPEGVNQASLLARGHAPGPPAAFVWRTWALRGVVSPEVPGVWPRYAEDYEFVLRGAMLGEISMHDTVSCVYQWVGGKSGASPRRSIEDAERIRMHYARRLGHPARPRSSAEITSMVFMRRASEHSTSTSGIYRGAFLLLAMLSDPARAPKRAKQLWSRVAGRVASVAAPTSSAVGNSRTVLWRQLGHVLGEDRAANPRDPKARLVMLSFRVAQAAMRDLDKPRRISIPVVITHRLLTEFLLGIELRPKTSVGPGLTIFHGTGLVVNDHAVLGRNVVLRNGVTIGHQNPGGGCPTLHDGVTVGASALILGDIVIGEGAVIGAGAVVVKNVAAYTSVAGNPARKIRDLPRS
jgi:putative colanic acid biosynthesis acetyltransferase WcaB